MVQISNILMTQERIQLKKMAENKTLEDPNGKKIKQFISIPFIWEEKPGKPKKDWKPQNVPNMNNPITTLPIKLVASIPFQWEEKSGKPLLLFPQSADIISPLSPPRHSEDENDDGSDVFGNYEQDHDFESDDSFSSANSLLANGLISSLAISNAVPVEELFYDDDANSGRLVETPPSPDSQAGSISSYATGTTSLGGASFLERLFPLLISGGDASLQKSDDHHDSSPKLNAEDLDRESNRSVVARRPTTLGELIMMSRRRSYQRKAIYMRRRDHSMEFMKRNGYGCCMFGGSNGIGQLDKKWKRQSQLKIM